MNTKWVGIVLLGVIVSNLSLAARTASYLDGDFVVGKEPYTTTQWKWGAPGSTWQDWNVNLNIQTMVGDWSETPTDDQHKNPYSQGADLVAIINNIDREFFTVHIEVPNVSSAEKTVWFEIVYQGTVVSSDENTGDLIENAVMLSTGVDINGPITDGVGLIYGQPPVDNQGWKTLTIGWTIKPSPSAEWFDFFVFGSDAQIKSISIDTLSHVVPAPGAVVLAGLGAAIVGYFRRKY